MDFKIVILNIVVIIFNGTLLVIRAMEGNCILAFVHFVCIAMMLYAFITLYISTKARKRELKELEELENNWKNFFESIEK